MKLFMLSCHHCGAPLEVPTKVSLFECLFCGSRLHVQWIDSVARAQEVEESARQVTRLASTPEQRAIEEEIARLDEAWRVVCQRFMIQGPNGQLMVPDKNSILIRCGFAAFVACMAFAMGIAIAARWVPPPLSGSLYAGGLMMVLGALMVSVAVAVRRSDRQKAVDFEVHQQAYQSERNRLLSEFRQLPYEVA